MNTSLLPSSLTRCKHLRELLVIEHATTVFSFGKSLSQVRSLSGQRKMTYHEGWSFFLVHPARFELATPGSEDQCSNPLSYGCSYSFTPGNLCFSTTTVSWVRHMFSLIARTSEFTLDLTTILQASGKIVRAVFVILPLN